MSVRYSLLTQLLAVAGGLAVLFTFAFGHPTANAIDFGLAIGITAAGLGGIAISRSRSQLALTTGALLVGAWTILVTAGVFSSGTQRWLTFASGAAVAGAALASHALETVAQSRGGQRPASVTGVRRAA